MRARLVVATALLVASGTGVGALRTIVGVATAEDASAIMMDGSNASSTATELKAVAEVDPQVTVVPVKLLLVWDRPKPVVGVL